MKAVPEALPTLAGQIFAANRAVGRIVLAVAKERGVSARARSREEGSLRVRFPDSATLEAVILNTAGGIAGGDHFRIEVTVGADASLTVTGAAAEKVYRSLGSDADIAIKLAVNAGARLTWLPQETILFDRARLRRSIEIELAEDASLLLAEAIVFGRSAMGEVVEQGLLFDRWRVRRGGRLIFADTVHLEGAIADKLAAPAVAAGGVAVGTVLFVPGDEVRIARVRALPDLAGELGVSTWNGLAVARLCAGDGAALRRDLVAVLTALGASLPRLWLN